MERERAVHLDTDHRAGDIEEFEADIDLCNPDGGLLPLLGHLLEVLWPGKTDLWGAPKWPMRRGVAVPLVQTNDGGNK